MCPSRTRRISATLPCSTSTIRARGESVVIPRAAPRAPTSAGRQPSPRVRAARRSGPCRRRGRARRSRAGRESGSGSAVAIASRAHCESWSSSSTTYSDRRSSGAFVGRRVVLARVDADVRRRHPAGSACRARGGASGTTRRNTSPLVARWASNAASASAGTGRYRSPPRSNGCERDRDGFAVLLSQPEPEAAKGVRRHRVRARSLPGRRGRGALHVGVVVRRRADRVDRADPGHDRSPASARAAARGRGAPRRGTCRD